MNILAISMLVSMFNISMYSLRYLCGVLFLNRYSLEHVINGLPFHASLCRILDPSSSTALNPLGRGPIAGESGLGSEAISSFHAIHRGSGTPLSILERPFSHNAPLG